MTPAEIDAFNQELDDERKSCFDEFKDHPGCKELFPEYWEEKEKMNPENQIFVTEENIDELDKKHQENIQECIDRVMSCV